MTNSLEVTPEILNKYSWTRLAVMRIRASKRQFFHTLDSILVIVNGHLSQQTFATDILRAAIYSLGHGRKYILAILLTIWRPGLKNFGEKTNYHAYY